MTAAKIPGGYNETYGYPDGIGAMIIETPFPYPNGPDVWYVDNPQGAYGILSAAGDYDGKNCEEIPKDSVFYGVAEVSPQPLTNGDTGCLLGCDWMAVQETGVDPCKIASTFAEDGVSNSPHSCYDIGDGMLGGWGACGYNCTLMHTTGELCPDLSADCFVYCDSRGFPSPTESDYTLLEYFMEYLTNAKEMLNEIIVATFGKLNYLTY